LREKMKKVLFLMFLLLLMGLGAAGVNAQVRIGGNTAPSAAAVLDLNAGNDNVSNTGTGGLVLPRVDLQSNTMQLTNGVANQTGTMVYNVTTTLGRIGVYYWNGNTWVLASLPSTTPADSGKFLMNNGTTTTFQSLYRGMLLTAAPALTFNANVTWQRFSQFGVPMPGTSIPTAFNIPVSGLVPTDLCFISSGNPTDVVISNAGYLIVLRSSAQPASTYQFACYRAG